LPIRLAPPISVVIPTTSPWPEVKLPLEAVVGEVRELGGELIVADASGSGLPAAGYDGVRWLKAHPGASVFELRALAVGEAAGDVIAITEDHCSHPPGWCAAVLAAHGDHPSMAVIGGPVENGSTRRVSDWGHYLFTFSEFMPPIPAAGHKRAVPPVNVSFKRWALPRTRVEPGWLELSLTPSLCGRGKATIDDRIRAVHVQSLGMAGICAVHFHNGRASTGLTRHHHGTAGRARLALRHALSPPMLVRRVRATLESRGRLHGRMRLAMAFVALAACTHAAGAVAGLLAGPGNSPSRLH